MTKAAYGIASAIVAGALSIGSAGAAEVWVTNMKGANVQVVDPDAMSVTHTGSTT
ncbi:MAG TPA: hypothetical protein VLE23_12695 [Geminicoccaceae bacterium]|nr:hypothetical protein [Geminicoccaceae bacterium]